MSMITAALRRWQLDKLLNKYREAPTFKAGCIREIREALGMSGTQLANHMGISQAATVSMERSEAEKSISLKTLARAAEALDCQLVYALVPKTSLEQTVHEQARLKVLPEAESVFRTMGLEMQSTDQDEKDRLVNDLIDELIKSGSRQLWQ